MLRSVTPDQSEKDVLRHINITIPSGSTVGIVGGTGSAKSSLVQLIPRLYDATDGSVRLGGRDVRNYDLDVLRTEVGMVLQKNILFKAARLPRTCVGEIRKRATKRFATLHI